MLAVLIAASVLACTFVGFNERVGGNAKAGFFVSFVVIVAVLGLLSWVMG